MLFLISLPRSAGRLLRLISTLNSAPLQPAVANKQATPTSETALALQDFDSGSILSNNFIANDAVL